MIDYAEYNPEVTVVMNTAGYFPELLEEAIYSVLNQTYQNIQLLIVNVHPDPLRLDKEYPNIRIINAKPFRVFPLQIAFALNEVETPYWCILDDDDLMRPKHVEYFIEGLREAREAGYENPIAVRTRGPIASVDNKISGTYKFLWWCSLYSKKPNEVVTDALRERLMKVALYRQGGFDVVIAHLPGVSRYHYKGCEPTYIYRLKIAFHISKPWLRQDVNPSAPLPIITPRWRMDYEKECAEYLAEAKYKPKWPLRGNEIDVLKKFLSDNNIKEAYEFGAGSSTYLMDKAGVRVKSFETDAAYGKRIAERLANSEVEMWNGRTVALQEPRDFVLIDGPFGGRNRRTSYEAAVKSGSKYIGCHDANRKYELKWIRKYLVGWELVAKAKSKKGFKIYRRPE